MKKKLRPHLRRAGAEVVHARDDERLEDVEAEAGDEAGDEAGPAAAAAPGVFDE